MRTLLLVEDQMIIGLAEADMLRRFGYDVEIAGSGEEAVEAATRDTRIDLVLMDVDLGPGIGGAEAARRILHLRELPIVFLTGHADQHYVDMVREITRYGYVIKGSGDFVLRSSLEMAFALFESHQVAEEQRKALSRTERLARVGSWKWYPDEDQFWWSEEMYEICGVAKSLRDQPPNLFTLPTLVPEDRDAMSYAATQFRGGGDLHEVECRIAAEGNGTRTLLVARGEWLDTERGAQRVVSGYVQDITALRASAARLAESERKYRFIVDNAPIGIFQRTIDGEYVALNEAEYRSMGCDSREEYLKWYGAITRRWDDPAKLREYQKALERDGVARDVEVSTTLRDGTRKWTMLSAFLDRAAGTVSGFAVDITQRKQVEQSLQDERNLFDAIIQGTSEPIFAKSVDGTYRFINRAGARALGHTPSEVIGATDFDILPQEFAKILRKYDLEVLEKLEPVRHDSFFGFREPATTFRVTKTPWFDARGKLLGLIGVASDVTREEEARAAAAQLSARLSVAMQTARFVWWEINLENRRIHFDDSAKRMFGAPSDHFRRTADFLELVHPVDRLFINRTLSAIASGRQTAGAGECRVRESDGTFRWYYLTGSYVAADSPSGSPRVSGVLLDVHDRATAQKRIQELLREKELLLREVHHRVRNNLNTIESLISLQANALSELTALEALQRTRARVHALGVLYDELFTASELRDVSARDYLPRLAADVLALYPNGGNIRLSTRVDEIRLPPSTLTTIGLLVNELITNAMKHAFPEDRAGTIVVELTADRGEVLLRTSDDGIGMPENAGAGGTSGFGLVLVETLTRQLHGAISIERNAGTAFVITFPFSDSG